MTFMYYDPVRKQNQSAESPEQLARQLADNLPVRTGIRFLNEPFDLNLEQLKNLQIHFEREQLPSRHQFACQIDPAEFSPAAAEILAHISVKELSLVLEFPTLDAAALNTLDQSLRLASEHRFRVGLYPSENSAQTSETQLIQLYGFLKERQHLFELVYPPGFFPTARIDYSFRRLASASQGIHEGHRFDAQINEQFYLSLYEFLRLRLSSRVNTILEINPFAESYYYREFNRTHMPWQVTQSTLPQHQLDHPQLESLSKTFDAIVLFQALPRLRDPQKELLLLQNYARSTTEWVCVQYNLRSLPVLQQLMDTQFHNSSLDSAYWPLLHMQGQTDLENLFQFSGIEFEWFPTRVPIQDLQGFQNDMSQLVQAENPEAWENFQREADVMVWTGYGTMKLELDENEAEAGFISGGFL